jgi:hypothetical protein
MLSTPESNPLKFYRLACFEEAVGILHDLTENEGILVADVGKVHLTLPLKLKESLWPLVGQRISILHTDLPKKEYLYRVLS